MTSFNENGSNKLNTVIIPASKYQNLEVGILPVSETIIYPKNTFHEISIRTISGTLTIQLDSETPVTLLEGDNINLPYPELNNQIITIVTDSTVNALYLIKKL